MTKIERLNTRVGKLLSKAVQEVLEVVKETVLEYQEKAARTQRENQSLKRRLQELQDRSNSQSNEIVTTGTAQDRPEQKEELEQDSGLFLSDSEATLTCPPDSFEDTDCEAPISSLSSSCLSPNSMVGRLDRISGNIIITMQSVRCVVVGDTDIGKTYLLLTYIRKMFPKEYKPCMYDVYSTQVSVDNHTVSLELRDTCGMKDYEQLRPLIYNGANVFIICFSVADPTSFANVKSIWLPEIKHYCPDLPILLVGTKTDLRHDQQVLEKLKKHNEFPVTQQQGITMAKEIKAVKYLECAAITQDGLDVLFDEAPLSSPPTSRMSKLERLNARVTKLLTEAVHEVLEMVKETVSEYQEKTARTMRENESLKRRLQELQDKMSTECTHGSMPEEKEAIKSPAQRLSLDVILTEQIPLVTWSRPHLSSYQEVTESRPSSELEAVDTLREAWHVAMKIHEKIVITYFESGNSRVDKEGYLYKKGEIKTSYQKRWCVLKGNLLFYKERPVDRDVIGVIVLEGCTVQLCESEEQFAFSLVWGEPGLRTYKFAAENQTSQESWIKALLSANHNYLALLVMDMEKKYRDTLSALYGEKANTFTVPHFSTAEAGYSASYQSSHMPTLHSYPGVTVGIGSGLSSTSALQTLSASPKTASKRSPKLWSKRNANAAPSNPAPPMREWVGICEGTKEEFTKLHEDFGKEVKELIADWSRRGRGDAAVQEENLIYFG
ncbi:hypothetical protein Q5P01_023321 [Channa striata]|uniref:PH domain-containing protein n=1 Tax=Channa striata TaxID=64152 RepID=A0AA88IW48_CHASR|nr:hypothetical protein Q5P01_023321 [Channa striata]